MNPKEALELLFQFDDADVGLSDSDFDGSDSDPSANDGDGDGDDGGRDEGDGDREAGRERVEEEAVEEAVEVFEAEEEGDVAEEIVHVDVDEDVEVLPHLRSTRSALWLTKTEQCRVCLLISSLFDPSCFTYQLVSTFLQSWTFAPVFQ